MFQKANINNFALNQKLKSFNRGVGIMRKNIKNDEGASAREQQIAFLKMQKPIINKSTVTTLLKGIFDISKNTQLERKEKEVIIDKQLKKLDEIKKELLFNDVDGFKKLNEQIKTITDVTPALDLYINKNEQNEIKEFKELENNIIKLDHDYNDPIIERELNEIKEQMKNTVEDGSKERYRESNRSIRSRIASLERALRESTFDTVNTINTVENELADEHLKALKKMINLDNINNTTGNDVWHAVDRTSKKSNSRYITLKKYNECWETFLRASNFYRANVNPSVSYDQRVIEDRISELIEIEKSGVPNTSPTIEVLKDLFKKLRQDTLKLIDWYQSAIKEKLFQSISETDNEDYDYDTVDDTDAFLEESDNLLSPEPAFTQSADGKRKNKQNGKGNSKSDYYVIKFK